MATLKPLPRTVYVGTFIHSKALDELERFEETAIGVDDNGVITFIEQNLADLGGLKARIQRHGWNDYDLVHAPKGTIGFWFPGFVDAHIHASQFPNAGIFGKTTLLDWLDTYTFPLESSLGSLPKAAAVYTRCVKRTLAHGTTTAAYFATVHVPSTNLLADICLRLGQRAFVGRCCMDSVLCPDYYKDASAAHAIQATEATIQHITTIDPTHALITPIITPRFALSCTPALLDGLGALHKRTGLPVQTHISENRAEISTALSLFPGSTSYAGIYDAAGLLTPQMVLAHGVHLTRAEIDLIRQRGASIAHCPPSNTCLGSGIAPIRELLDAGVPVGLGTDVSGGYSPSVLAAAREAGAMSRLRTAFVSAEAMQRAEGDPASEARPDGSATDANPAAAAQPDATSNAPTAHTRTTPALDRVKLTPEETLHLATRGGARCIGLQARVGGFAVGMEWDAQFVDLGGEIGTGWGEGEGGSGGEGTATGGELVAEDTSGGRGNVECYAGQNWAERIAKWVFCGDERNTRAVWVRGRLVSGGL